MVVAVQPVVAAVLVPVREHITEPILVRRGMVVRVVGVRVVGTQVVGMRVVGMRVVGVRFVVLRGMR